jgi:hypothetical protein
MGSGPSKDHEDLLEPKNLGLSVSNHTFPHWNFGQFFQECGRAGSLMSRTTELLGLIRHFPTLARNLPIFARFDDEDLGCASTQRNLRVQGRRFVSFRIDLQSQEFEWTTCCGAHSRLILSDRVSKNQGVGRIAERGHWPDNRAEDIGPVIMKCVWYKKHCAPRPLPSMLWLPNLQEASN